MYVLSDLAQEIIKLRAASNDWVLVTHPQKEKLPADLFAALPSQKVAQEVLTLNSHHLTLSDTLLDCAETLSPIGICRITP